MGRHVEGGCAKGLPSTWIEQGGCCGSWWMEEAGRGWVMVRMVGWSVFLLVLAHPGSPGQGAVKRLLLCVYDTSTLVLTYLWCRV